MKHQPTNEILDQSYHSDCDMAQLDAINTIVVDQFYCMALYYPQTRRHVIKTENRHTHKKKNTKKKNNRLFLLQLNGCFTRNDTKNNIDKVSEYDQKIPPSHTATHIAVMKSHGTITVTRHHEDYYSKATSSFFPIRVLQN